VTGAFAYYLRCNVKNQTRARLRRLRRPRYLVSAIAGLAYLYATSFRFLVGGRRRPPRALSLDPTVLPLLEIGAGIAVLVFLLLPWILPLARRGIAFKEAEIQFLFPAPLGRRALLHFRILKGQIGILFGVAVSAFFLGRGRLSPHPSFTAAALWIFYTFLALYNIGTTLARSSLADHGVSGLRHQGWVHGTLAAVAASVAAWIRWFIPPPPVVVDSPEELLRWIGAVAESGPAYYLLLPGRWLAGPALAPDLAGFLRALVPALTLVAAASIWVVRSDTSFEEASVERAEAQARASAARTGFRKGQRVPTLAQRRPWCRLDPVGHPIVAFFWKYLIAAGRFNAPFAAVVAGLIAVVAISQRLAGARVWDIASSVIGAVAAGMAAVFVVLGPVLQRDDLRSDLLRINFLKSLPTPGWGIVLGEVLAPATVLAVSQWGLLAIAAFFGPDFKVPLSGTQRLAYALAAAIILPGFGLLGLLVQNATALLIPGWVQLGKERQHGVEAMGQRLIMMAATLVVLVVAVIPSAVAFATCYLLGYRYIGLAVVPLAAAIAALGLVAESTMAILWLGRVFDRFDPSADQEVLGGE
jgi:hypothetical protein